jgi:hypothetical protein
MTDQPVDYDGILQAHLAGVFSERDPELRIAALRRLYTQDAVLYEPDATAKGHDAISAAVTALLAGLPPDFTFHAVGPAVGHSGAARLRWRGGAPDGSVVVTGTDVALLDGDRIRSLYVFLDPTDV